MRDKYFSGVIGLERYFSTDTHTHTHHGYENGYEFYDLSHHDIQLLDPSVENENEKKH